MLLFLPNPFDDCSFTAKQIPLYTGNRLKGEEPYMENRRTLQTAYTIVGAFFTLLGLFLIVLQLSTEGSFSSYSLSPLAMGWMLLCLAYVVSQSTNGKEDLKVIRGKASFWSIILTLIYIAIALILTETNVVNWSVTQWLTTLSSLIIITLFTFIALFSRK